MRFVFKCGNACSIFRAVHDVLPLAFHPFGSIGTKASTKAGTSSDEADQLDFSQRVIRYAFSYEEFANIVQYGGYGSEDPESLLVYCIPHDARLLAVQLPSYLHVQLYLWPKVKK